jgi:mannose-6-phosphate isomerase
MNLYPLKFNSIYKDKIWGGNKIRTILNKDFGNLPNCGESWELSGVSGNISVVKEGPLKGNHLNELIEQYRENILGEGILKKFGKEFPLLIKFIDANEALSIQVHPDDSLAKKRHNSAGKTEMWYIIQADHGATLISGFNREMDKTKYLDFLNKGALTQVLNIENAEDDDAFFIPAGRVHTIGKGLLLAEIQQSSDVTYRIYDFDRRDHNGRKRELHTEQSIDAIDYHRYEKYKTDYDKNVVNEIQEIVNSKYFITNKLLFKHSFTRDYEILDSFVILICLKGSGIIEYHEGQVNISKGDVVLLPAVIKKINIEIQSEIKLLETYISSLRH